MSFAEWTTLPEDEPGEWVDGYLMEEEVADPLHDVVVGWLIAVLRGWVRPRGGFVGASETKFAVSAQRGRKPDVWCFLSGARVPPARGIVRVAPDLMCEVVSATPRDERRDRVEKLAEYAAFGVRYYWVVDPQLRTFEIFEQGADGRYVHALGATGGRVDGPPGCAGMILDLDSLWAEVDALGAETSDA